MKAKDSKGLMRMETAMGVGDSNFYARVEKHEIHKTQEPIELHWHTYYEFEFVVQGTGIHTLNNVEKPIKRGSAYLCLLTDFHTIRSDSDTPLIIYNFKFNPRLLSKNITDEIEKKKFYLNCNIESDEDIRQLTLLCESFYYIMSHKQKDSVPKNELITHTINQIIAFFLIECDYFPFPEENLNTNDQKIQQAALYIHQNFTKNISQADVANRVQLTTPYFSALFREKMECNYATYITRLRLNYAKNLIDNKQSDNVSELCNMVGFYSTSYFIKKFKKEFGLTPKEQIIKCK